MTEKKGIFKIAGDLIWSIIGLVAMNGVLQLLYYPTVAKKLTDAEDDNVLTLLAIVAILSTMFGTAANYARMVARKDNRDTNGDFNVFLLISFPLSAIVCFAAVRFVIGSFNIPVSILLSLLAILSILRYYGDVEFRLNVNFKRFSFYYILIAIGYAIGSFFVAKSIFGNQYSWVIAIALGELLSVLYVIFRGNIFRGKDIVKTGEHFRENLSTIMVLVGTNVVSAAVLKCDSILIRFLVPTEGAVKIFYVATLVGKIVALLTTPLNGVIIGYLTKYKGAFTKKLFTTATLIALVVGVVFTICCLPVSHIFVKLMYDSATYEAAKQYFFLANAGQILYFVSGSMMVVVLRFIHERWQLIINVAYAVLYAVVVVPMVIMWGLWGITYGLIIVNALRFLMVVILGYVSIGKDKANEEKN